MHSPKSGCEIACAACMPNANNSSSMRDNNVNGWNALRAAEYIGAASHRESKETCSLFLLSFIFDMLAS